MEFGKVVAGALYYVNQRKGVLAKALAIPFCIYLALDAAAQLDLHPGFSWLFAFITLFVQTLFAITTHRIVLLGPDSVPAWGLRSWTSRETFYVLHGIGMALLMIPIGLLGLIPAVGVFIAGAAICWVIGRLSLVFPGIAVDKGVSFSLSWEMTQDYQLLMFLVVVIFPVLLALPTFALGFIPYSFWLISILSTLVIVFEVAALSMAFQLISERYYQVDVADQTEAPPSL